MRIEIAQRLRPYSHCPGTACLLPGSSLMVQVFPALLRVSDVAGSLPSVVGEVSLNVRGPVKQFTVLLDLERGCLRVWGHSAHGFVRYRLHSTDDGKGIVIAVEKEPNGGLLKEKKPSSIVKTSGKIYVAPSSARLSLGSHKKQDWTLVRRRGDLREVIPMWMRLGALVPRQTDPRPVGTATLLDECRRLVMVGQPEYICDGLEKLFLAGFHGLLAPRLVDDHHQGIAADDVTADSECSPLILCTEGARILESLFVHTHENTVSILPALPPLFHCGRLLAAQCGRSGKVNLEWSKKLVRRMIFFSENDGDVLFLFQKELKSFRLRLDNKDKGTTIACGTPITVTKGQRYWLDRFRK